MPAAIGISVRPDIVVIEGNYLLVDSGGWEQVRPLLDAVWYVEADDEVRRRRLIARHEAFGKTRPEAIAWADGSDAANALLIATTRDRADEFVENP